MAGISTRVKEDLSTILTSGRGELKGTRIMDSSMSVCLPGSLEGVKLYYYSWRASLQVFTHLFKLHLVQPGFGKSIERI